MKINRTLIISSIAIVAIVLSFFLFGSSSSSGNTLLVDVDKGEFVIDINTTGELEAKNSVKITGPGGLRNFRIWNVTIQKIINEGTFVKKGEFVASLDPTELTNKINEAQIELQKIESQFIQTKLDTTLQMRESRDQLINLQYAVREAKLILEQSRFEPPATVQKAQIEYEKAQRQFNQAKENLLIKKDQNIAKMQEVSANLRKQENELNGMKSLMSNFTIIAPEDGMIIYKKGWDGKPLKQGSQISAWDPVVATLPDLSKMISKTYVNEVDIRRIQVGQEVEMGLDAFPDKKLTGKVVNVANVGEQRPNSDAKVFLVTIDVNESDELLKPSMTTSNKIYTKVLQDVVSIPLECLHSENDSITYVFKKSGINAIKQEVLVGETNSNSVTILEGLSESDKVYLSNLTELKDESVQLLSKR